MSKHLAICCDLDDCVFSFLGPFLDTFNEYTGKYVSLSELRNYEFDREMSIFLHEEEDRGLYLNLPLEHGAITFLNRVFSYNIRIFFVTARPEVYERDTRIALARNGVPFDKLIFSKSKADVINHLKSKYDVISFIDDRFATVQDVYMKCALPTVFLIDKPHNQNYVLDNTDIVRVKYIMDIWNILIGNLK